MFNTTITRTTSYGYSNTCTLADAMINRQRNMCSNLAACFGGLRMAICMKAQTDAARKNARKAAR